MRTVVCLTELKTAAIYFDRVVPLGISLEDPPLVYGISIAGRTIPGRALASIVFDKHYPKPSAFNLLPYGPELDRIEAATWTLQRDRMNAAMLRVAAGDRSDNWSYNDAYLLEASLGDLSLPNFGPARMVHSNYLQELDAERASVIVPNLDSEFRAELRMPLIPRRDFAPTLALLRVPLVDAESADWDQILQLRADAASRRALQRLRAFMEASYEGKSISFVEDDLARRLEDYEIARRKHGFDCTTGSISAILHSQSLVGVAGLATCAALIGGPVASLTTAAVLEIANISIEIAKRRQSLRDWEQQHELAYVFRAKSRLRGARVA